MGMTKGDDEMWRKGKRMKDEAYQMGARQVLKLETPSQNEKEVGGIEHKGE